MKPLREKAGVKVLRFSIAHGAVEGLARRAHGKEGPLSVERANARGHDEPRITATPSRVRFQFSKRWWTKEKNAPTEIRQGIFSVWAGTACRTKFRFTAG